MDRREYPNVSYCLSSQGYREKGEIQEGAKNVLSAFREKNGGWLQREGQSGPSLRILNV